MTVIIRIDIKLNGVIASSDSGHVPFELLNLATLEEVSQRDSEQVSDETANTTDGGKLVVLSMLLALILNAGELNIEKCISVVAILRCRGLVLIKSFRESRAVLNSKFDFTIILSNR